MTEILKCLDKGYVRLVDTMGSDLTVANSARVSYAKESFELNDKDIRLIKFLAKEGHHSPFRHAFLQFEVYAPLMVARQWWKYVVGSDHTMDSWNESSRRYITEEPVFYVPQNNEWRSAPENSKQGSGEPLEQELGSFFTDELENYIIQGEGLYNKALQSGVCAEQARLFLPSYGLYVRWYWSASLQSVCHFLNQRLAHDAQKEIVDYAKAVYLLAKEKFPVSIEEIVKLENEFVFIKIYCKGNPHETKIQIEQLDKLIQANIKWYGLEMGKKKKIYAVGTYHLGVVEGKKKFTTIMLHRFITNAPDGYDVDHVNGDTLNNTDNNLNIVTVSENLQNMHELRINNVSGTTGICWHKNRNKWQVNIAVGGKHIYLGVYEDLEDAIKVRMDAEKKYFLYLEKINKTRN
jgi:thymidylate synthase (FAD)